MATHSNCGNLLKIYVPSQRETELMAEIELGYGKNRIYDMTFKSLKWTIRSQGLSTAIR